MLAGQGHLSTATLVMKKKTKKACRLGKKSRRNKVLHQERQGQGVVKKKKQTTEGIFVKKNEDRVKEWEGPYASKDDLLNHYIEYCANVLLLYHS